MWRLVTRVCTENDVIRLIFSVNKVSVTATKRVAKSFYKCPRVIDATEWHRNVQFSGLFAKKGRRTTFMGCSWHFLRGSGWKTLFHGVFDIYCDYIIYSILHGFRTRISWKLSWKLKSLYLCFIKAFYWTKALSL